MDPSIALWLNPVTWPSVLGHEDAEAGEPATSMHAATVAIAPAILSERGTHSESSAGGHAQRRPYIFSRASFTPARLGWPFRRYDY
jgi:hypothetical protein